MPDKKYVFALILFFAVSAAADAAILMDKVVAVVNQEVITWSELYRNMEFDANPQVKELKDKEKMQVFKANEAAYLETLINVKLQLQEARSAGLTVTDEELKEAMDGIKKKYNMSETDFMNSLKKEGFALPEYRKKLQEQILLSKVVGLQIRNKIVVNDAEVTRFLAENKEFSSGGEGYRISQIFFKKPKDPSDRKAVEDKADLMIGKIKAGENFADLAKKYSEEPLASSGGDLGLIKKDQLMSEFSKVLAGMKQGDVSNPFWTDRGLHIIRLDEAIARRDEKEIREDAHKELSARLFAERYNVWIKALREKAFIDIRL